MVAKTKQNKGDEMSKKARKQKEQAQKQKQVQTQEQAQTPTPAPVVVAPVVVIASTTLGRYKSSYQTLVARLTESNVDKAEIEARLTQRMSEDSMVLGITLEDFKTKLATIKSKASGKLSDKKEQFRSEFNRLLDKMLFAVNATADKRLRKAMSELLAYDLRYQDITEVVDTDRDDWRGLIVVAPYHADKTLLARYVGGWKDGSKNDRNQYSSGRRVPVAKSTGYTREQMLPE